MTATPPEVLGAYLPVVPAGHDQIVVSDGSGRGLSRRAHRAERILSGELLPRSRSHAASPQKIPSRPNTLVSLNVRPQARAIAAYAKNASIPRAARPRVDLRV